MTAGKPLHRVPKLRFAEFVEEAPWEYSSLKKLAKRTMQRNTDGAEQRALTNSAEHGVVDQRDYFDKRIATNTDNYYIVEPGDYVYNPRTSSFAPVGPISRNQIGRGVMSPLYTVFRFRSEANDFFAQYFKSSHWHAYLRRASNSGARHDRMAISTEDLMRMPIPTPSPHEQKKIADCLDSLDDLIALERRKLEALRQHRQGLMQQLLPEKGETVPPLRFPDFRDAGRWEDKKLDNLAKRGSGHTPSRSKAEYYDGDIYWVSLADSWRLDSGLIIDTKVKISEQGIRNSSATLHHSGSVILSRDAGVGKSAVLGRPMAVSQHFIVWSCDTDRLYNWFLYYFLQVSKSIFESIATGSTIKTIGLPFFKKMRLVVPLLAEQRRIADCLLTLDDQIAAQIRKLSALETHKKGLLQQLFPLPGGDE